MKNSTKSTFLATIIGLISGGFAAIVLFSVAVAVVYFSPAAAQKILHLSPEAVSIENETNGAESGPNLPLTSDEQRIIKVVERVQPAVVSVIATADVPVYEQYYEEANPFDPFGFSFPQYRQKGTEEKEISSGSGFLVSADGYVVTNKHVVSEQGVDYTVISSDGTKYPAAVVAVDPTNDIAVVKIEGAEFSYLEFGNSDKLQVGQSVIAIGNALGEFSNSVSVGVVSGLARSIQAGDGYGRSEQLQGVIQTDAAINFGNSGGPLLNLYGQVIGMNVAMAAAENIGFALPSNSVRTVVESVKTTGKISRPFLGVRYLPIDAAIQTANDLPVDYGVLVLRGEQAGALAVIPGSPADVAGIEENDIILEIDGQKLDAENDLATIIVQKKVGDEIEIKLLHDGEEKIVTAKLTEK